MDIELEDNKQFISNIPHMGKMLKSLFSQNMLKANGINLQWVIKVVKHFSYNQNFVPEGYLPLPLGYIHV